MSGESRVQTVVVAGGGAPWESAVLDEIHQSSVLHLRRRCLDVPELLSLSGLCDVAIVSTSLAGLDADSVLVLQRDGVRVVGVGDESRGRRLGIDTHTQPGELEATLATPVSSAVPFAPASVIAVWGPHGAPGRSVIASSLASTLAHPDGLVTLVDADGRGGSQAQLFGVLDDVSGLVAACRSANRGDVSAIAANAVFVAPGLRLLTGVVHAEMWDQVRESLFQLVLRTVTETSDAVIVDLGPGMDAQTRHVLTVADRVVVVGRPDPVGLARLVRSLHELSPVRAEAIRPPVVVLNQVRPGTAWTQRDVADAVQRLAGIRPELFIPADFATLDTAALRGRTPAEIAADSPFVTGIGELVERVAPAGARRTR